MSGGVDSTAVATTAHRLHAAGGTPALRGYTVVYDRLIPDDERHYAGMAAEALGMPIEFLPFDHYRIFDRCAEPGVQKPEPYHWPLEAATLDVTGASGAIAASCSREKAETRCPTSEVCCTHHGRTGCCPRCCLYAVTRRRCPPLGIRTRLRSAFARTAPGAGFPGWLNHDFAQRTDSRRRLEGLAAEPPYVHPTHARAHAMLSSAYGRRCSSRWIGFHPHPLEFRHPLFDVRVMRSVLAIPLMPWSVDKELLRSVTAGVLPAEVRRRRKSPLGSDPIAAHVANGHPPAFNPVNTAPRLAGYVDLQAVPRSVDERDPVRCWMDLRPRSLDLWLQHA